MAFAPRRLGRLPTRVAAMEAPLVGAAENRFDHPAVRLHGLGLRIKQLRMRRASPATSPMLIFIGFRRAAAATLILWGGDSPMSRSTLVLGPGMRLGSHSFPEGCICRPVIVGALWSLCIPRGEDWAE